MADGNNNIISLFWSLQRPHDLWVFKWGSDCFKGCYTVKTNISLTVKKCLLYHWNCGKFFTRSDIIFIIPLSVKTNSWYIELFELCKTSKSRHLHTTPMYLRHVFARSEIMNIISLSANKNFRSQWYNIHYITESENFPTVSVK